MSDGRATYRGVRWRRDDTGTTTWWNEGLGTWVRWYPGADAPPLPPTWPREQPTGVAPEPVPAPAPRRTRPGWGTPYRLVPVAVVVAIVVIGTLQATSGPGPVASETARADSLAGRCLARNGTSGGHPSYAATPVACTAAAAAVEVRSVLPGTPGAPHCPPGTTAAQLRADGVRYPHVECVVELPGRSRAARSR